MTQPPFVRSAYLIFGLLAAVDLLVVMLVPHQAALILLGLLLAVQVLLTCATHRVSCLLHRHAALRRAYEHELHFSRQAMEGADLGLTLIDGDGRITYANAACQALLGCPAQDILGKRPADFAGVEGLPPLALTQSRAAWPTQLRCPDGRLLNVLVSGRPYWHQGRLVGSLATIVPLAPSASAALASRELN